ncbi:hypothetical protein [Bradyrhizobium sp. USDA 10063]
MLDPSCIGNVLDDIPVDDNGMCQWTDVANAQLHMQRALRTTMFEMQSRIDVLEEALTYISNRRIMDGVTAISMRAVATAALRGVLSS